MNIKKICMLSLLICSPLLPNGNWDRELNENEVSKNMGTTTLGGITCATGGALIAKGFEKTIVGNTGCNYPSSFIVRSFRGGKTRLAGVCLLLAGLATFDLGATILTQPADGMKLYQHVTHKISQPIHSFFSLFAKNSNNPQHPQQ